MTLDYDKLMKRYEAAQKEIDRLANVNTLLTNKVVLYEQKEKQWNEQKILQDQIIQHQISESDNKVLELQNEIIELRKIIGN